MLNPASAQGVMVTPFRFAQSIVGTDLVAHSFYGCGADSIFIANTTALIAAAYPALCSNYISDVITWLPDMLDKWLRIESAKHHAEQRAIEEARLVPAKVGPFNY